LRLSAFIETFIFLAAVIALSNIFGDGTRFYAYSPHPFWAILLLIVVQYGTNEALMCTALMTLALYTFNMPPQNISQSLHEYWLSITWRPILWMVTSIIIGGLRTRKGNLEIEQRNRISELEKHNGTITDSYDKLQLINEALEHRLAGEVGSALQIYEAAKSLESAEASNRIERINDIVQSIINPDKFSFYTLTDGGLKQLSNSGWTQDEGFKTKFSSRSELFQSIVTHKNVLSVINESDEKILDNEGVLAGPLIDLSTGEVQGMLKVEEIGFKNLSLRSIHMFHILCEWIGMAISNMNKIQTAASDSMIDRKHMLYSYNFLKCQSEFLTSLAVRMNFNLTKLHVKLTNTKSLTDDQRSKAILSMGDAIRSSLRQVDQFFDEENKGEEFAVLLPGTCNDNAEIVIGKIKEALKEHNTGIKKAKYSFTVQTLNKTKE